MRTAGGGRGFHEFLLRQTLLKRRDLLCDGIGWIAEQTDPRTQMRELRVGR